MPFCLVEDTTPGQFAFLVAVEVKSAGHTADVMTLGPQYEKRCQDEDDNGNGYYDDPFHGKLVAGRAEFVTLRWYEPTPMGLRQHLPLVGPLTRHKVINKICSRAQTFVDCIGTL